MRSDFERTTETDLLLKSIVAFRNGSESSSFSRRAPSSPPSFFFLRAMTRSKATPLPLLLLLLLLAVVALIGAAGTAQVRFQDGDGDCHFRRRRTLPVFMLSLGLVSKCCPPICVWQWRRVITAAIGAVCKHRASFLRSMLEARQEKRCETVVVHR